MSALNISASSVFTVYPVACKEENSGLNFSQTSKQRIANLSSTAKHTLTSLGRQVALDVSITFERVRRPCSSGASAVPAVVSTVEGSFGDPGSRLSSSLIPLRILHVSCSG